MKKIVDRDFLEDEKFVTKTKELLNELKHLVIGYNPKHENQKRLIVEMAIDNRLSH